MDAVEQKIIIELLKREKRSLAYAIQHGGHKIFRLQQEIEMTANTNRANQASLEAVENHLKTLVIE